MGIGEPIAPPRMTPARGPPLWEQENSGTSFSMKSALRAIRLLSRNPSDRSGSGRLHLMDGRQSQTAQKSS